MLRTITRYRIYGTLISLFVLFYMLLDDKSIQRNRMAANVTDTQRDTTTERKPYRRYLHIRPRQPKRPGIQTGKLNEDKNFNKYINISISNITSINFTVTTEYLHLNKDYSTKFTPPKLKTGKGFASSLVGTLANYSCPHLEDIQNHISVKFICRGIETNQRTFITLFTTMHDNINKLKTYNNTLSMWSQLYPHVRPVLYIAPSANATGHNTLYLIQRACDLNWSVALAPVCNNGNYPLIRPMYHVAYSVWQSEWYGYVNGDIIFDRTLVDTLYLMLRRYRQKTQPYTLLSGFRINLEVNTTSQNISEMYTKMLSSKINVGGGADYFITPRYGFPWHYVPPSLAIGLPQIDNYMLWLAKYHPLVLDVDLSEAIMCYHQGLDGWKAAGADATVNDKVIVNFLKTANFKSTYLKEVGTVRCMNHKLGFVSNPYMNLYRREMTVKRYLWKNDGAKCGLQCCHTGHSIIMSDNNSSYFDFDSRAMSHKYMYRDHG